MADIKARGIKNSDEVPVKLLINKGGWTMKLSQFSLASLSQAGVKKICAPKLLKYPPGPPAPSMIPPQTSTVPPASATGNNCTFQVPVDSTRSNVLNNHSSQLENVPALNPSLLDGTPNVPTHFSVPVGGSKAAQINNFKSIPVPVKPPVVKVPATNIAPPSQQSMTTVSRIVPSSSGTPPKVPCKRYTCPKCQEEYPNRKLLAIHKKTHPRLFSCDHCKAEFKSAKAVELHSRAHTGERPYHCSTCNKWFRRRDYLKAHQEIHTGARPHVCGECNVSFRLRSSLIRHARLHTGERPYKCDVCSEAFTNKHVLKIHQSTHTGHRPYMCGHCGMSFIVATNLKRHVMIHTGEKPYRCEECGERFIQQHHLTQHRLKHSGDTPYQCSECNAQFKFHSSLNNHIKSVHKGIPLVKRIRKAKTVRNQGNGVVLVQSDVQLTSEQQAATLDLLNNICMTMERNPKENQNDNCSWKLAETSTSKDIETAVAIAQAVSNMSSSQTVTTTVPSTHVSIPQIHQQTHHHQETVIAVQNIPQHSTHQNINQTTHAVVVHQIPQHQGQAQVSNAGKEQGQQATFFRPNQPNRSEVLILPFHRHFGIQPHSVGMW